LIRDGGMTAANIRVLKGAQATRAAIRSALAQAAARVRPQDHFVFYFAGHGTQVDDRPPYDEPDRRDEALCASDADNRGGGLVLDDELGRWLEDVNAGQVTVILDCCHAGTGTKDAGDDLAPRFLPMAQGPATKQRLPSKAPKAPWRELRDGSKAIGRRTASYFACLPDQQAYERRFPDRTPPSRSGQFTHYFLEGLQGKTADADRDGVVSHRELIDYTSRRLDETFNSARSRAAERQQAVLEADSPDSPLLSLRRTPLPAPPEK